MQKNPKNTAVLRKRFKLQKNLKKKNPKKYSSSEEEIETAPKRKKRDKKDEKRIETESKSKFEDNSDENNEDSGIIRRGTKKRTKEKEKEIETEDNINYENKMQEKEPQTEAKPLADYSTHTVSSAVYNINARPKDDDSDEWEEIPMEEEVTVSKPKNSGQVHTTKGLILDESDDEK
eukprot:1054662_1